MTKSEAIRKIKELQEYIERLADKVMVGQIWKRDYGSYNYYLITEVKHGRGYFLEIDLDATDIYHDSLPIHVFHKNYGFYIHKNPCDLIEIVRSSGP